MLKEQVGTSVQSALIGSQQINTRLLELSPVTGIDFWHRRGEPHGLFISDPTHTDCGRTLGTQPISRCAEQSRTKLLVEAVKSTTGHREGETTEKMAPNVSM